jgi:hypothetical protein
MEINSTGHLYLPKMLSEVSNICLTDEERVVQFVVKKGNVLETIWRMNPCPNREVFSRIHPRKERRGTFWFLDLPPETRNMICILALKTSSGNVRLVRKIHGYFFTGCRVAS